MKVLIEKDDNWGWVPHVGDGLTVSFRLLNWDGEIAKKGEHTARFDRKEDAYLFAKTHGWDVVGEGEKSKDNNEDIFQLLGRYEDLAERLKSGTLNWCKNRLIENNAELEHYKKRVEEAEAKSNEILAREKRLCQQLDDSRADRDKLAIELDELRAVTSSQTRRLVRIVRPLVGNEWFVRFEECIPPRYLKVLHPSIVSARGDLNIQIARFSSKDLARQYAEAMDCEVIEDEES